MSEFIMRVVKPLVIGSSPYCMISSFCTLFKQRIIFLVFKYRTGHGSKVISLCVLSSLNISGGCKIVARLINTIKKYFENAINIYTYCTSQQSLKPLKEANFLKRVEISSSEF